MYQSEYLSQPMTHDASGNGYTIAPEYMHVEMPESHEPEDEEMQG